MNADFTPAHAFVRTTGDVLDPDLREVTSDAAERLEQVLVATSRGLAKIAENRIDSEARKTGNARLLVRESTKLLAQAVVEHVKLLEKKVELSEAMLRPEVRHRLPNGTDRLAQREQEREIRDLLRAKYNDLEIRNLYLQACRDGDQVTMRAVELAPAVGRLVDEDAVSEGAELYCEAAFTEAFELLQQERSALSTVRENVARASHGLQKLAPTRIEEPAADTAE